MTVADGDVLRIVAKFTQGGDEVQNVYHVRANVSSPPTDAALAAAVGDYMDDVYTSYRTPMSDDMFFSTVATYNETQDAPVGEVPWPTLVNGGQSANRLPPQCSPLLLFTTSVLNSLGKKYLPALTSGSLDPDGSVTTAALTTVATLASTLLDGYDGLTWSLTPGNYRKATAVFIPYLAAVVRDIFATQRRRYVGKGS